MKGHNMRKKKTKVKKGWRDQVFYAICGTILTLALIVVLFPMMNIVSSAFSDPASVTSGKVWFWPVDFSLDSFKKVLKFESVWIGYKNTIFYTTRFHKYSATFTHSCSVVYKITTRHST